MSIKPLHSLVAGLMHGLADPELLFAGGESPHRMSLTPSLVSKLIRADLVIWVGGALEPALERAIEANVDADNSIELIELAGLQLVSGHGADIAHAAAHDHHETDPHIWLSPYNAGIIVRRIAARLSAIDSQNSETYRRNESQLISRLEAMVVHHQQQLDAVRSRPYIVFHDAYRYLEKAYRLSNQGALTINPERLPGARHIHQIQKQIADTGARCLFSEPQFSPKLVEALVAESGVRTGVLDPLGASLKAGTDAYFLLMDALVTSLVGCLSD